MPKESKKTSSSENPVDLTQLKTFTDGSSEALKEFIVIFVRQADESIRILHDLCTGGKSEAWAEAAHLFKGGAAAVGAHDLTKLCHAAQFMNDATAVARVEQFEKIANEYAKIKDYLNKLGLV